MNANNGAPMKTLTAALAAVAVLATACAHAPVGHTDSHDVDCGDVTTAQRGALNVRLRDTVVSWPALMTCDQARAEVTSYAQGVGLRSRWAVIFTAGTPGLMITRDGRTGFSDGSTYERAHVIVVRAVKPWMLAHEFLHAQDVEQGRENGRD